MMNNLSLISIGLKNLRLAGAGHGGAISATQRLNFGSEKIDVPARPKRPLSPYLRYAIQIRPTLIKENPNIKPTEVMKLCGVRWDSLANDKKEEIRIDYRREMDKFAKIMEKYNSSLTDVQKEEILKEKNDKHMKKESRERKRREKDLGKPKKPLNAFLLYLKSHVTDSTKTIDDHRKLAVEAGDKWKSFSEADKLPYLKEYDENVQAYYKNLAKWEERMIKQGNHDLVRQVTAKPLQKKSAKST